MNYNLYNQGIHDARLGRRDRALGKDYDKGYNHQCTRNQGALFDKKTREGR